MPFDLASGAIAKFENLSVKPSVSSANGTMHVRNQYSCRVGCRRRLLLVRQHVSNCFFHESPLKAEKVRSYVEEFFEEQEGPRIG